MALRTIAFLIGYIVCAVGSLFNPLYGIVGYVVHYLTWPEMQWWGNVLNPLGVRYSLTLAVAIALGILLNCKRLKWGKRILTRHELLILFFLASAFVANAMAGMDPTLIDLEGQEGLMGKLCKVILFALMLSHVVTDVRRFRLLLWVLVLGSLYLGFEAYNAPIHKFQHSRLNLIGGPDFSESSFFGAHLAATLPFIGIFFLYGTTRMKLVALVAGGFSINAIVLTRTRAVLIGLLVGLLASLVLKLPRRKLRLIILLIPAAAVSFYLTDEGFWRRMETILNSTEHRERSSADRLAVWQASVRLIRDYPMGIGVGRFTSAIGRYDLKNALRDSHNTLIRCAAELGIHNSLLLAVIIVSSWITLIRARQRARGTPHESEIHQYCFAVAVCQCSYLACGMFMTTLFIEAFWWFLMLPVCLLRCAENAQPAELPVLSSGNSQDVVDAWAPGGLPSTAFRSAGAE